MAESILARVQRVLSSGVESATQALEQASGPALMREAIREVERATADIHSRQTQLAAQCQQAEQAQIRLKARLADLETQARFALGKAREDLARAAVSQQIACEAEIARLKTTIAEASGERRRLDRELAALIARKKQMDTQFAAFQATRTDGAPARKARETAGERARRRVDKAETAFERLRAQTGGQALGNPKDAEKLAEVDALRRDDLVAERLAALRGDATPPPKKRARAR